MNRFSILCLTAFTALGAASASAAEVSEKFVVVHCESPGTLTLSEEALIAPNLKVTGDIDRNDFETLKYATINVTRILDLSETVIQESFAYVSSGSDWMVGDPEKVTYPADMLPTGAFSELRDNTINKFTRGSSTLTKVILPASLKGFMKGAFTSYSVISDLEVPKGSTTLRQDGKLIYSYDGATLLALPPACFSDITVAASVSSVAEGVFDAASPASVTFSSVTPPSLPEGAALSTAYIIAPDPEAYSQVFPEIDCIRQLDTITLTEVQPGELMNSLADMGYSRKDIRSVKISGILSTDDFKSLQELPNLHAVDLSEAVVQCVGYNTNIRIANPSITAFKFPEFSSSYYLTVEATSSLHGDLQVPHRAMVLTNYSKRFTSVRCPSSLLEVGERSFPEYNITESLDLSQCTQLKNLKFSYATQCLSAISLPPALETLSLEGPVKEIVLPSSLKEIYGNYWMVENLILPKSLEACWLYSLPMVREIDANAAHSLYQFNGLSNVPNLRTLDLTMCPLNSFSGCGGAYGGGGSVVVSGGTKYPAASVCGIENISLPSTLTSIRAFTDCPKLHRLDLMHCFRLESLGGLNKCPALVSLTLPENLKTMEGILDSPSLVNIQSAAAMAPAYSVGSNPYDLAPLDFSKVSLTVVKGGAGVYRMSENWENCKEISDEAYRVSISQYPINGGVDDARLLLLYGAGLYAPGSEVMLYGYPSGYFAPTGWSVNEEIIKENPCKVALTGNIAAAPDYSFDSNLCDVVIKVDVPERQTMKMTINSARRVIYVDGNKSAWWNYTNFNENTYNITLNAGVHEVAIACAKLSLAFDRVDETPSGQTYRVTDFRINNRDALLQLYPGYFDMEALDLSGQASLNYLSARSGNHISTVDITGCPQLDEVSLYDSGIGNFIFDGGLLTDVRLSGNLLTEFDPTGLPGLRNLELNYNQIRKLDISNLENLRNLDIAGNGLAEFIYGGNVSLATLYIFDNALPALNLSDFPAMEYCSAYGQQVEMAISTENFDTTLLGNVFEISKASDWHAVWYTDEGYTRMADCTVDGSTVIIPVEAGNELILRYKYLISDEQDKSINVEVKLNRENFNSVDGLVADRNVRINGNRVLFADGVEGEVYTLSGVLAFKGTGESPVLAEGVYIVRVESSVRKIAIP